KTCTWMSMSPGVTYRPEMSMLFLAPPEDRFAATAAIFPPRMPTSRTPSTPFRGSMTCPPFRTRSYGASCAEAAAAKSISTSVLISGHDIPPQVCGRTAEVHALRRQGVLKKGVRLLFGQPNWWNRANAGGRKRLSDTFFQQPIPQPLGVALAGLSIARRRFENLQGDGLLHPAHVGFGLFGPDDALNHCAGMSLR